MRCAIQLVFSLIAWAVSAQPFSPNDFQFTSILVSTVQQFSPTNVSSATPIGWWCVSSNYTTNASVAVLGDLYVNHYDLTNGQLTSKWPTRKAANLNGLDTLYFNGSLTANLCSGALGHHAMPFEVYAVCSITNIGTGIRCIWSGTNGTTRTEFYGTMPGTSPAGFTPYAGNSFLTQGGIITNKWIVIGCSWSANNLALYTNNITTGISGNGTGSMEGFFLGCRQGFSGASELGFAELAIYSGALSTTERTSLYTYWTNKYNL